MSCPICLDDFESENTNDDYNREIITFECKHSMHRSCALDLLDKTCPFCRQEISFSKDVDDVINRNIFTERITKSIISTCTVRNLQLRRYILYLITNQISKFFRIMANNNIPFRYIPREIDVTAYIYHNKFLYESDYIYDLLVSYVVKQISEDVADENGISSMEEMIEMADNPPFAEENKAYDINGSGKVNIKSKILDIHNNFEI